MNQTNSSKQVLLSVIGVAILVVAVVGVSFAFFNYTRTGAANTITTGQITFTSTQVGTTLSNAFPVTKSYADGVSNNEDANVVYATVAIVGSTSYNRGLDYRITAVGVDFNVEANNQNGIAAMTVPVRVDVTTTGTLGTNVGSGSVTPNATPANDTTQYKVYQYRQGQGDDHQLTSGSVLAEGHIANSAVENSAVNGTFVIRAYLDADMIAITDTSVRDGDPVTTPSDGSSNGTTGAWINGRAVMTTAQWNSLSSSPLTFQIRVESVQNGGQYAYNNANSGAAYNNVNVPGTTPRVS